MPRSTSCSCCIANECGHLVAPGDLAGGMLYCVDTKLSQEFASVVATLTVGRDEPTCPAGGGRCSPCQEGCHGDSPAMSRALVGHDSGVVALGLLSGGVVAGCDLKEKRLLKGSKGLSDSGGSSSGNDGGQSSDGKQQKSGSESSNSSSQQSGSGSRSGGGRKAGGSCSRSGSSDSSGDDEDDEEKRRRPHHGVGGAGKDSKPKLVDEDDEATDSADEGVEGDATPNSMIMDFSPPQSNQSGSGTDHTSKESQFPGSYTQRPTSLTPTPNHYEGKCDEDPVSTPLDNQGATGTIAIETMAPMESSGSVESSHTINMIVGYGVPASAPHQALDKTPPGSELGTPTLDSPPPPLGEEKSIPLATPVPITPILSPALTTLLPQVTACLSLLFTAVPKL